MRWRGRMSHNIERDGRHAPRQKGLQRHPRRELRTLLLAPPSLSSLLPSFDKDRAKKESTHSSLLSAVFFPYSSLRTHKWRLREAWELGGRGVPAFLG